MRSLYRLVRLSLVAATIASVNPVPFAAGQTAPHPAPQTPQPEARTGKAAASPNATPATPAPGQAPGPAKAEATPAKPSAGAAVPVAKPTAKPDGKSASGAAPAAETKPEPKADAKPPVGPASSAGAREVSNEGAPSLQEVLSRISSAIASQNVKAAADAAAPAPAVRSKPAAAKATAARPKPAPLLTWDPALTSGGVALSWDEQISPHRARPADLGVRLVWPARVP
jgi:nicotinate-nucleotide--dimethylbenzimidazole phosphoribosyltransferase